jgi:YD repeat-containing protein
MILRNPDQRSFPIESACQCQRNTVLRLVCRTLFAYEDAGNLWRVTDPRNLVTTFAYNSFGELTQRVSPDTGTTGYTYDSAGRMISETRANGVTITYTWDALDRMTSRTAGAVTETYTYDEGSYGKGRLTRINDASGQTSFTYSAAGELVQQVNTILGVVHTTTWTYDAAATIGVSHFSFTFKRQTRPLLDQPLWLQRTRPEPRFERRRHHRLKRPAVPPWVDPARRPQRSTSMNACPQTTPPPIAPPGSAFPACRRGAWRYRCWPG